MPGIFNRMPGFFMRKKLLMISALIVLIMAACPVDTLAVRGFKKGDIRHVSRVSNGDPIVFSYIHSVSKTPIEETLEVSKGLIHLVKVSYIDQGGAGMPEFGWGSEKFKIEDGKFVLEGFQRDFQQINITVQRAYDDRLKIGDHDVELIGIAKEGENISVACERKVAVVYVFEQISANLKANI